MRWINIRNGIKQRINEILGVGDGSDEAENTPTYWSIQAAMLENSRRIVKSIVGDTSDGRPMKGCWITKGISGTIDITAGLACTANGDIIVFDGVTNYQIGIDYPDEDVLIYLRHINVEISEDDNAGVGKKTGLIGQSGDHEIVNDDHGVDDSVSASDVVRHRGTPPSSDPNNFVLLGTATTVGGVIVAETDIVNTKVRGLAPNAKASDEELLVPNLKVGDLTAGEAEFYNVVVNGALTGTINMLTGATINIVSGATIDALSGGIINLASGSSMDVASGGTINLADAANIIKVGSNQGVSGSFKSNGDAETITVNRGIITSIA